MKRVYCHFFLFLAFVGQASADEKVDFNLVNVPLVQVVTVLYGQILREPYFIDETVKADPVSVNFKGAPPESMRRVLDDYLSAKGVRRVQVDGVNLFRPSSKGEATSDEQGKAVKLATAPVMDDPQTQKSAMDRMYSAAVSLPVAPIVESEPNVVFLYRGRHRSTNELMKVAGSILSSGATLVGDDLLLMGPEQKVSVVRALLNQLDLPSGEVVVKATVAEYTSSEDDGLGVMGALKLFGERLGLSIGSVASIGQNLLSFKNATIEAVLSLISGDSRFNVVDTSTLRVLSGKVGSLIVGQEVPVLGSLVQTQNGQVMQNINYRNAGLQVEIKPVLTERRVQVEVKQTVSSFAVTRSSNIDSPTLLKREFSSALSAELGEVVVLGGLDEQKDTVARSGLFGFTTSKVRSKSRTSLFLILQFQRV